jgi:hypothetical protein
LIKSNKATYLISTKEEKTAISRSIVATIREQQRGFLERGKDKIWYDIGDAKATEKTSQALREGQPDLRQKMIDEGIIIKDPSTMYSSPPRIAQIVTPQSKQELAAMAGAAPTMPDNNFHTSNFSGHHGSNLFARDYINIIGHNKNQCPQSMGHSLDHHLLEKDKMTTAHHPYDPSNQQQLEFLPKKHPDDYEDTTMVSSTHHQSSSQHHSSHLNNNSNSNNNYGMESSHVSYDDGEDDLSSHSIMMFDFEIEDDDIEIDDDDLLDNDDPLPPNYYPAISDEGNNDSTMNYSEKTYHVTKSVPSNSQHSDNDNYYYSHHHQHQHGNQYFEYENKDENNRQKVTPNNTFEDIMWGEDYNDDDDSGIISLGFLCSVMSPTTETDAHYLLAIRRTHTI